MIESPSMTVITIGQLHWAVFWGKKLIILYWFQSQAFNPALYFVLNEVVDYYLNNGSSIFLVLLDASKAFDWVQYIKLLESSLNMVYVQNCPFPDIFVYLS